MIFIRSSVYYLMGQTSDDGNVLIQAIYEPLISDPSVLFGSSV